MKIRRLDLQNFMLFHKINTNFSPNLNIICGENSTGKTALIKLLYSCVKSCETLKNTKCDITKEKMETYFFQLMAKDATDKFKEEILW